MCSAQRGRRRLSSSSSGHRRLESPLGACSAGSTTRNHCRQQGPWHMWPCQFGMGSSGRSCWCRRSDRRRGRRSTGSRCPWERLKPAGQQGSSTYTTARNVPGWRRCRWRKNRQACLCTPVCLRICWRYCYCRLPRWCSTRNRSRWELRWRGGLTRGPRCTQARQQERSSSRSERTRRRMRTGSRSSGECPRGRW
jgi:hypothetical protein